MAQVNLVLLPIGSDVDRQRKESQQSHLTRIRIAIEYQKDLKLCPMKTVSSLGDCSPFGEIVIVSPDSFLEEVRQQVRHVQRHVQQDPLAEPQPAILPGQE